jgi:hypothetical protein
MKINLWNVELVTRSSGLESPLVCGVKVVLGLLSAQL